MSDEVARESARALLRALPRRRLAEVMDVIPKGLVPVLAGLFLCMAGCSGGDGGDPLDPGNGNGTGTGGGVMKATIDGTPWQSGGGAFTSPAMTTGPGGYSLTGASGVGTAVRTISLSLMNIPGPGTYPLGTGGNVSGGTAILADGMGGWLTPLSGAAGTITVTTLSDTRFVGTFAFTAEATTGTASGTRTVTAGSVDLPISIVAPPGPVPERNRNRMHATIGGEPWNAATIASAGAGGIVSMAGSNTRHLITIVLADYVGLGTYPLGGAGPRIMSVAVHGPNGAVNTQPTCCWTSATAGASGNVVIVPSGPERLIGSFSFVLPPQAGTGATGPLTIVDGHFDLGRGSG